MVDTFYLLSALSSRVTTSLHSYYSTVFPELNNLSMDTFQVKKGRKVILEPETTSNKEVEETNKNPEFLESCQPLSEGHDM